jgi:hypothetical protein
VHAEEMLRLFGDRPVLYFHSKESRLRDRIGWEPNDFDIAPVNTRIGTKGNSYRDIVLTVEDQPHIDLFK